MQTIERAIDELPAAEQIALQHIARAECLGVEITSSQLPASKADRENLYANAMRTLEIRLIRVGLL